MQTLQIVKKLIEKTKKESIRWQSFSVSQAKLKPLKGSVEDPYSSYSTLTASICFQIRNDLSYCAKIDNGYFFLLAGYAEGPVAPSVISTANDELIPLNYSLRVQSDADNDSIEIIGNYSSEDEQVQLIRLYNLVKSSTSNVTSLLNHFLDS